MVVGSKVHARLVAAAEIELDAADVVGVQVVEGRPRAANGDADLRRDGRHELAVLRVAGGEGDDVEQQRPLRLLRPVHERVEQERERRATGASG